MISPLAAQDLTCSLSSSQRSRTCSRPSLVLLNVPLISSVAAPATSYSLAPAEGTVPGSAYEVGYFTPAQPLALTLRSNGPANIYLRATRSTFNGSSSVCTGKSITTASVSNGADGPYAALVTSTPGILVHQQTTATSGEIVQFHFRIALNWSTDRPVASACSLPLQLTLRTN